MISDEKKLELINEMWQTPIPGNEEVLVKLIPDSSKWYFAMGFLAALRQLGPVIDCAKLAKSGQFDLSYMQIVGEEALRQAGLEE